MCVLIGWILVGLGVAMFFSTLKNVDTHNKQREKELEELKKREQQIIERYTREQIILRGEALCNDGCSFPIIAFGSHSLSIRDKKLMLDDRELAWPNCFVNGRLHKFGLDHGGNVYVSYYAHLTPSETREEFCTIEKGPFVAIILEEGGRLKFN